MHELSSCCQWVNRSTAFGMAGDTTSVPTDPRGSDAPELAAPIPVLWLCGPPGVGKTTVAWEMFTRLTRAGVPTGYVDVDQLGICYPAPTPDICVPEPAADPGRYVTKNRNVGAAVATFRAAGARCVIVSGVVDERLGVDLELIPNAFVTVCRLRADAPELRRRLIGRSRPDDRLEEASRYAAALDRADIGDVCVDTTGRSAVQVIRLVGERTGGWPWSAGPRRSEVVGRDVVGWNSPMDGGGAPGEILWLCGATGVGKSTAGWQVWERIRRTEAIAAFVDLDQVGFFRPAPADDPRNHRVKARNLAGIWRTYRGLGVRRMVVVGPVDHGDDVRVYADALGTGVRLVLCRLHAGREQLAGRIRDRGRGGGPPIPGDELVGQPDAVLDRVCDAAAVWAAALARLGVGDLCVDTDGRSVAETADLVVSAMASGI